MLGLKLNYVRKKGHWHHTWKRSRLIAIEHPICIQNSLNYRYRGEYTPERAPLFYNGHSCFHKCSASAMLWGHFDYPTSELFLFDQIPSSDNHLHLLFEISRLWSANTVIVLNWFVTHRETIGIKNYHYSDRIWMWKNQIRATIHWLVDKLFYATKSHTLWHEIGIISRHYTIVTFTHSFIIDDDVFWSLYHPFMQFI